MYMAMKVVKIKWINAANHTYEVPTTYLWIFLNRTYDVLWECSIGTYVIPTKYLTTMYTVPTKSYDVLMKYLCCTYAISTPYQRQFYDVTKICSSEATTVPTTYYYVPKLSWNRLLTSYFSCTKIVCKMLHINCTLLEVRWPLTEFKSLVYSFIQMHFSKSIQ